MAFSNNLDDDIGNNIDEVEVDDDNVVYVVVDCVKD